MRFKSILGLAFSLFATYSALAQFKEYNYKFQVNGAREKDTVYLANYVGKSAYYFDTAYVQKGGVFTFKKKKDLRPGIFAVVLPQRPLFEIILNEPTFSVVSDTADMDRKSVFTGSPENQLFKEYKEFMVDRNMKIAPIRAKYDDSTATAADKEKYKKQLIAIDEEVKAFQKKTAEANPNTYLGKMVALLVDIDIPDSPKDANGKIIDSTWTYYYYKAHYFDRVDFKNDFLVNCPLFQDKMANFFKTVVIQFPDSIVANTKQLTNKMDPKGETYKFTVNFVNETYNKSDIMGMDAVFVGLADEYYLSGKAYWLDTARQNKIRTYAENIRPILIGKPAYPLSLADTTHQNWKKLYDEKNEFTVLVFWEPTCGHCKKEMPILADLYNKTKGKEFSVYAVSGYSDDKWTSFIKEHNMTFTNVAVPDEIKKDQPTLYKLVSTGKTDEKSLNYSDTYDVYSTPKVFILDKDKKIVAKQVSIEKLDELLGNLRSRKN